MKGKIVQMACLWGLISLAAACGDNDENLSYYPSVRLEFVTVRSGENGSVQTLVPDKGHTLTVTKDRSGAALTPNTIERVLSNYEVLSGGRTAVVYSLQSLITPEPKPQNDPAFENGMKHDPAEVVSIWLGRDYLNMILNLKINTGKGNVFDMVEDVSELQANGIVTLLLYHDAGGDEEYYNRRAYVSVPLSQYIDEAHPDRTITIKFSYYTRDKDGAVTASDKYCDPGFEYVPGKLPSE